MYRLCIGLFIVGLVVGCGAPAADTEQVTGLVTLDGEPVAGATVTFRPVEGGMPAAGLTDDSGIYTLTGADAGAGGGAGTTPGEYLVTVMKIGGSNTPDYTGMSDEEIDAMEAELSEKSNLGDSYAEEEIVYIVPEKYGDFDSSGLQVTVVEGANDIPLELTSN